MSYLSRVSYNGDGSNRIFAIPFGYINESDISLFVGAVSVPFIFLTTTSIQAVTAPAAGSSNVTLTRVTENAAMLATIQQGTIRPEDVNLDNTQLLYLIQEMLDGQAGSQALRVPFPETISAFGNAVARANNFPAFDAAGDASLLSVITPVGIVAGTKLVYASQYATLALADVAAAALTGGVLVIDKEFTLGANTTLTCPKILFLCKVILGNYDLTGTYNAIMAGDFHIFGITGSGRLKGNYYYGMHFLVSWLGIIGVDGNQSNSFTASAVYAAANKTLLQALEDYAAQANEIVCALFTRYMTAFNGGVTNSNHFSAVCYCGINRNASRLYIPDGAIPRTLTGGNNGSLRQDLYRDLSIFGKTDKSTPVLVEVINWVGACLARRCYFSLGTRAIRLNSNLVSSVQGFSEDCYIEDVEFDNDCGVPLYFLVTGGTGSFRGFEARGINLWSTDASNSDTMVLIGPSSLPYDWGYFNLVVTAHTLTRALNIFDNQGSDTCNIHNLRLDLESGDATYKVTVAKFASSAVTTAGGAPAFRGGNCKFGKFVWNCNVFAISANRYFMGGRYSLEFVGFLTVTGNGTKDLGLLSPGAGGYTVNLLFRAQSGAAAFTARVIGSVMPDDGDGFTGGAVLDIKILSNTGSVTFTNSEFSVGNDGLLKCTAQFGGLVVAVTGCQDFGSPT